MPLPIDFGNGDDEFAMFTCDLYDFDLPNNNRTFFFLLLSIKPSLKGPNG
jgi:hypothetical protein